VVSIHHSSYKKKKSNLERKKGACRWGGMQAGCNRGGKRAGRRKSGAETDHYLPKAILKDRKKEDSRTKKTVGLLIIYMSLSVHQEGKGRFSEGEEKGGFLTFRNSCSSVKSYQYCKKHLKEKKKQRLKSEGGKRLWTLFVSEGPREGTEERGPSELTIHSKNLSKKGPFKKNR